MACLECKKFVSKDDKGIIKNRVNSILFHIVIKIKVYLLMVQSVCYVNDVFEFN